jgi:hypothetical protein
MTTGGIAYLVIAIAGFSSFVAGLLYASLRAGGGNNRG